MTSLLLSIALFLVTDSAGSIIYDADVCVQSQETSIFQEYAKTGYDGLFSYSFTDEDSVRIRLTAEYFDTLYTTVSHKLGMQRIYMKHSTFQNKDDDRFIRPFTGVKGRAATMPLTATDLKGKETIVYEVATSATDLDIAVLEEDVAAEAMSVSGYSSASNNLPSAGKLTAGEVNDFAKWRLWDKILTGSHKEYVGTWNLCPKERYRVLVCNKDQYPLADIKVQLRNNDGEVVFTAKTDNTGHAELWANFDNNQQQNSNISDVICFVGDSTLSLHSARPFPAINTFVADAACSAPEAVDVFFIADATGSMGDELRYLRAEMIDVINRSGKAAPDAVIRTGALVYRDHGDEYISRISPLSNDIQVTQKFLEEQRAGGGGDYPEAVPEALMAAINSADWSENARTRIAFLILDAPCHEDSLSVRMLREEVLLAAEKGIRVVPVVCSGLQESGELLMRCISLLTNGTNFFLTDDSGIGNTHLKPTTDSLKVEHLNDMLVRTIIEFSTMPECNDEWAEQAKETTDIDDFVPNPFSIDDLDSTISVLPQLQAKEVLIVRPNPCREACYIDLPLGTDALFLSDISGKSIRSYGTIVPTYGLLLDTSFLPTGVYFVKAFYGGRWYSQKLIVN